MIKRYTGWRYTYKASSNLWWQDIRGKRWVLIRGVLFSGRKYLFRKFNNWE